MSRPTQYSESLGKAIAKLVEQGSSFTVACQMCGVNSSTGRSWLRRNATYATAIKKAESKSEAVLLARIVQAGKGTKLIKKKYVVGDDGIKRLIEQMESTQESWQPNAWMLERRFPDRWSRKTMDITQAIKVLIDAGIAPPEMIDLARAGVSSLTEQLKAAFQGVASL